MTNEVWKPVLNFPNYEVSNFGRVRTYNKTSTKKRTRPKLMKQQVDKDGYFRIALLKNNKSYFVPVHRLVLLSFIGLDENKKICNHKDGKKKNNVLENLEWTTPSGNVKHAIDNGLLIVKQGEKSPSSKINKKQAKDIIKKYKNGESVYKFHKEFNLSTSQIYRIINGENWKNLDRSILC